MLVVLLLLLAICYLLLTRKKQMLRTKRSQFGNTGSGGYAPAAIPVVSGGGGGGEGATPVWSYSMNSAADQANPEGANGSAELFAGRHTTTVHSSSLAGPPTSWDGGDFLRVTINDGVEDEGGPLWDVNSYNLNAAYSVGFVIRAGSDVLSLMNQGGIDKWIMIRVGDGTSEVHNDSPLITLSAINGSSPTSYAPMIDPQPNGTGREGELGGVFPNLPYDYTGPDTDFTFHFDDYAGQWLYLELTHAWSAQPQSDGLMLSVYTRDGTIASQNLIVADSYSSVGNEPMVIRFMSTIKAITGATANTYWDISDVYLADAFMGPPTGFVTG